MSLHQRPAADQNFGLGPATEVRLFGSLADVGRDAWDACFSGELEGYDYLMAVEAAGLSGFDWRYCLVKQEGRVIAAAPAFFTDYSLDTTLTDSGRRFVAATRKVARRAFTVRMACLGSPCTDDVRLGFAPDLSAEQQSLALKVLLEAFEHAASDAECWLLAVKDAPEPQRELWSGAARDGGYHLSPGMPAAVLDVDFQDIEAYLSRLSRATRKDMRRKLRAMASLRIELVSDLSGLEPRIIELYRQTRHRSDLQFEDLTIGYFTEVLARMKERALCVLYWAGDDLLGFNLLLEDGTTLLDKLFCMDTRKGPAFNLYFVSWFTNVRLCIERGLTRYQSGQVGYENKLRLGSRLVGADLYFRHRRPLANCALRWAAPLLSADPVLRKNTS